MPPVVLITLYVVLALATLAVAVGAAVGQLPSMRALAAGLGLVAFAMLLMQFISSGRVERICGKVGINRTMRFHQLAAWLLLLLVILHPLLFYLPDTVSDIPQAAQMFGRMLVSDYMLSGSIALFAVLFMVASSVWRHKLSAKVKIAKYEHWRAIHVLGAILVAIAGAHHTFSIGSYSQTLWLRVFWWMLLAAALGAVAYTYLLKPWLLARSAYRVASVRELGQRIWEIVMEPAKGRAITFTAGQFAWVNFRRGAIPIFDNPFSISSSPGELPRVRLLIKARGDGTSRIGKLAPGTTVYLDAPHGNFTLAGRTGAALYLIAGGIGIAPMIAILRDLADKRDKRPISLIFGASNPRQLIHADEIRSLQKVLALNVFFSVDEPPPGWTEGVGEFDAATIRRNLPAAADRCLCLVCGPTPMMLAVERHLLEAGVPRANVVYERFDYD